MPTLKRPEIDPDYPMLAALGFKRDGEVLGNDDYLRVGDSAFEVPPTSISVHDKTDNHPEDVLRTPGGIVMANGFSEKEVTIELRFTSSGEIFGLEPDYDLVDVQQRQLESGQIAAPDVKASSLAALLAQFRQTPVVPVVNTHLNVTHNIHALALTSLLAETWIEEDGTPLPNAVKVTLQCMAFAYEAYAPSIVDFDAAIIWPIFRWNWQQAYAQRLPGEYHVMVQDQPPSYPPLSPTEVGEVQALSAAGVGGTSAVFSRYGHRGMTGEYQFSIVARSWLDQLNQMRDEYLRLQAYTLSDDFRNHTLQAGRTAAFSNLSDLAKTITELSGEQYARMEVQDLGPDLVLTHLAAQITNNFVPQRLPNVELPAYQHMSQGDVRLVASFWCTNESAIQGLKVMIEKTRDLARESRFELVAGFIGFQNEMASLFGVQSVVFTDVQSQPVDGIPGNWLVSVEMIAFDRMQKRIEAVTSTTQSKQYFLDQNPTQASGSVGPLNTSTDPRAIFWQRYRSTLDPSHDPTQPSSTGSGVDRVGRPVNAWFNAAYIQEAKEKMAELELYPDLHLPTWERLEAALQSDEIFTDPNERAVQYRMQYMRWVYWNERGRFVDPDFYIDYPNRALASKLMITGGDVSDTSSFLAHAIAGLDQLDPVTALHVDGSISGALSKALFDSYPDGGMYGPDPTATGANMAGESGWARGNETLHVTLGMPTHDNKTQTSVFKSVFNEPGYHEPALTIDGKNYNVQMPVGDVHGHDSPSYENDPRKALAAIPGLKEEHAKAAGIVTGTKVPQGTEATADLMPALMAHHPMDIGAKIADEHGRLIATCNDLFNHDQTGRMVQAYPAYVMQLLDEGPRMGWVKIFPNFFSLQSVQSIDIISDRREPADTAIIELMNTYGNLSSYTQLQQNLAAYTSVISAGNTLPGKIGSFFGDLTEGLTLDQAAIADSNKKMLADLQMWREGLFDALNTFIPSDSLINNVVALRKKQTGQVMLSPGVRVHLRMGYGSNGATFPPLFNGRVTDIGYGERIRVIAMGDGLELDKLIPTAESETNSINRPDRGFIQQIASNGGNPFTSKLFESTYEPREIICQMLNSHGEELFDYGLTTKFWNWMKTNIRASTNGGAYADNPIGITHFGNPYLFNLWNAISGKGLDGINSDEVIDSPRQLDSYGLVKDAKGYQLSRAEVLLAHSMNSNNPFLPGGEFSGMVAGLATGLVRLGDFQKQYEPVSGIALKLLGEGASLLTHQIPSGYGETGENVYAIYTPFSQQMREMGTFFSKHGMSWMQDVKDPDVPDLPTMDVTPMQGAHPPGVTFNMYTKNKTVWDICTTMAQYFPPYIAAVRPFEYRSTLFFGAPYFTYRYDYHRMTAEDIGANKTLDKFYGYPVAYKTKPFAQFHIYDTKVNLLSNNVRASDEETYTDVIAMWYKGQGMAGGRPEPYPVHQTVDRAIAPAFKRTAVVNTDVMGFDTAPTKAAIIGSGGTALLGYWASQIGIPFTDIGIAGGMNHFIAEENVRHMARAILRDYQKLMYQGNIVVIGDPTVRPHDVAFINDDYQDMRGPVGVRRVIHHFGFESGFITSIEPDLAVEVKGHPFWTSFMAWLIGFGATSAVLTIGQSILAARGARRFTRSALGFGLKTTRVYLNGTARNKAESLVGKLLQKTPLTKGLGVTLAGEPVELAEPRFFVSYLRRALLTSFSKVLGGSGSAAGVGQGVIGANSGANYKAVYDTMEKVLKDSKHLFGQKALTESAAANIRREVYGMLEHHLDDEGRNIVMRNLFAKGGSKWATVELGEFLSTGGSDYIVTEALGTFVQKNTKSLGTLGLPKVGFTPAKLKAAFAAIKTLRTAVAAGGAVAEVGEAASILAEAWTAARAIAAVAEFNPIGIAFQIVVGFLWTGISRWWDDETSLQMCFLTYRGQELSAGLTGHQDAIVMRPVEPTAKTLGLTEQELQAFQKTGMFHLQPMVERMIVSANQSTPAIASQSVNATYTPSANYQTGIQLGAGGAPNVLPSTLSQRYNAQQRAQILSHHGVGDLYCVCSRSAMQEELIASHTDDRIFTLLDTLTKNNLKVSISAAGAHSHPTASPNHWQGLAIDVCAIAQGGGSYQVIGPAAPAAGNQVIQIALAVGALGIGLDEYLSAGWKVGRNGNAIIFSDAPGHIHVDFRQR